MIPSTSPRVSQAELNIFQPSPQGVWKETPKLHKGLCSNVYYTLVESVCTCNSWSVLDFWRAGSKIILETSRIINPPLWFGTLEGQSSSEKILSFVLIGMCASLKKASRTHKSIEVLKFHYLNHRYSFGMKLLAFARCACCCHLCFCIILCNCHHESVTQKCQRFSIFV